MNQFVTFKIGDTLMGIDILNIREINRILDITPVQHTPDYVRGLVNLRGQTVTVFDLGVRLGLSQREITAESHNVILKNELVGLLVDSIGDVVSVDELEINPPPANIGNIERAFIDAVVKQEDELLMVLSAKKILENAGDQKGKKPQNNTGNEDPLCHTDTESALCFDEPEDVIKETERQTGDLHSSAADTQATIAVETAAGKNT